MEIYLLIKNKQNVDFARYLASWPDMSDCILQTDNDAGMNQLKLLITVKPVLFSLPRGSFK